MDLLCQTKKSSAKIICACFGGGWTHQTTGHIDTLFPAAINLSQGENLKMLLP